MAPPPLPPTHFTFTSHGSERARERQITEEEFRACVLFPTTKKQQRRGENGGFVYVFTRRINGEELTVVAEVKKEMCWYVTGFRTKA